MNKSIGRKERTCVKNAKPREIAIDWWSLRRMRADGEVYLWYSATLSEKEIPAGIQE